MDQRRDAGGRAVNDLIKTLAECRDVLLEFHRRQIQVKDLKRGLIDFPSYRDGREIFLCWERDEEDIEFWHDLETGFAARALKTSQGGSGKMSSAPLRSRVRTAGAPDKSPHRRVFA